MFAERERDPARLGGWPPPGHREPHGTEPLHHSSKTRLRDLRRGRGFASEPELRNLARQSAELDDFAGGFGSEDWAFLAGAFSRCPAAGHSSDGVSPPRCRRTSAKFPGSGRLT